MTARYPAHVAPRNTIRCPWCTARVAEGARCAACGCEPVDASDYGVARMLRAAGVDRIALPERARTLDGATRARLEHDWRAQRELVEALAADGALAAAALPTAARLLAELADELAQRYPVSPSEVATLCWPERPGTSGVVALEAMREGHPAWGVRALAVLALAWCGAWRRDTVDALRGLAAGEGVASATAAAALCGWRARREHVAPRRLDEPLERALAAGLALPELAPWSAVARALVGGGTGSLQAALTAVGDDAPLDLRLGAALALADEARLAAFVDDEDEQRRAEARRALSALGSERLLPLLAPAEDRPLPPDDVRRALLHDLPHPLPRELRGAVMACFEQGGDELASLALRVLQRGRYHDRDDDDRGALGAFAVRNAERFGAGRALALLAWCADGDVDALALAPFVAAARAALARAPAAERGQERDLDVFLRVADDDDLTVLEPLLHTEHSGAEQGARLLGRVLDLHARRDDHALSIEWIEGRCARFWTATPACVAAWARALASRSGMSGREQVLAFFWRRFCAMPEERSAIATALGAWSHLLHELRDAAPPSERPGGDDVVAVWDVWSAAEPHDMWRLVDQLGPTVPDARLAAFAERVFDAAEGVVAARPRTGIVTVFRVCAEIANRVRREPPSDQLDLAVAVIERRAQPFAVRFGAAAACEDGERGAEHFLEDIATERRLIAEVLERRREAAERAAAREAAAREAAARQASAREEHERQARLALAAQAATPAPPPVALPQPAFARGGLDDEPFVSGPGPRTLVEYAQLLRALKAGNDALGVFAAFGLDPTSWAACAGRWSALLTRRHDVALRFAALLSEQWR